MVLITLTIHSLHLLDIEWLALGTDGHIILHKHVALWNIQLVPSLLHGQLHSFPAMLVMDGDMCVRP